MTTPNYCKMKTTLLLLVAATMVLSTMAACPNSCSGHGTCSEHDKCTCFMRKDGTTDALGDTVPAWIAADCSQRTCPYAKAWVDVPKLGLNSAADTEQNNAHRNAECANAGTCDRSTGLCECFPGYEGRACDRSVCPNSCSGHGTCQTMKQFYVDHAEFISEVGTGEVEYDTAWDATKLMGCKCESGYRGPDCSLKECPSLADPQTGPGGKDSGLLDFPAMNNVEYRDCSGRGICDYETGLCQCFEGAYGEACNLQSILV